MRFFRKYLFLIIGLIYAGGFYSFISETNINQEGNYFSPNDMAFDQKNNVVYVSGLTAKQIKRIDLTTNLTSAEFYTNMPPKALAISNGKLLTACSYSEGELMVTDLNTLKTEAIIKLGHGSCDVVVSPEGNKAFVANQFSNDISVVDLHANIELSRIPVLRQPMVIEISKNGQYLFAANFITAGRADVDTVTAVISVIDLQTEKVIKNIPLANGSNALRGMSLSSDGNYIFISHNLGRFQIPTSQLEQGWMNTSAISVINAKSLEYSATILLDEPGNGAAGSWGIDCTLEHIIVAHSGTQDFSVIDYPKFIDKLNKTEDKNTLSYDLRFLSDLRKRIKVNGNGPRIIKNIGNHIYVANYFSDAIDIIDLNNPVSSHFAKISLNENLTIDSVRLGEIYFNDATYCFQGWQSCNGCHPDNARTDGLNWDLLNDGIGNPKNCKSMLLAHETSPAMITGIRPTAEIAVRAGFTHIQFVQIEEGHAIAVDKYLNSLKAIPSPFLIDGELSPKAQLGKQVYDKAGCKYCHSGNWHTDLKQHEIGTQGKYDHQNKWDTPTLVEVWRTGPYLHDGRSATMKEVFINEKHGLNSTLSEEELDQLVEYVLSL